MSDALLSFEWHVSLNSGCLLVWGCCCVVCPSYSFFLFFFLLLASIVATDCVLDGTSPCAALIVFDVYFWVIIYFV